MEKTSFSPGEFCRRHGISKTKFYEEVRAGRLIARKVGSRTIVTAEAEAAWLAALPALPARRVD